MRINAFLIQKLNKSSKEVKKLIEESTVLIDNIPAVQKQKITYKNSIEVNGVCLQLKSDYFYFAYYKPRGVESTMNKNIDNNLYESTGITSKFFPIGRLDKDSEGLMLLTNNGALYNTIISPLKNVEKEYLVAVDKELNNDLISQLSCGVEIMGKKTKECLVHKLDEYNFRIILTEGKNRQIRRMCYKLNLKVITLKRIRIGKMHLGSIQPKDLIKIALSDI
jgi:23S rRNA pseudouridine2604 synthase